MNAARILLVLLAVAAIVQSLYYYPIIPETVASHFDGSGQPNGWSSKQAFITIYMIMVGMTLAIFLFLPPLLSRMPNRLINLPHKDHWLAPTRRAQSLAYIQTQLNWFGVVNMMFIIYTVQLVFQGNLAASPRLSDSFVWALAAYAIFVAIWLIRLFLRFKV